MAAGESKSERIIAIVITMQTLSTIVLVLRQMTRMCIQHIPMRFDDYSIIVAWVLSVTFTIDVCVQTTFGLGKHVTDLPAGTNFVASQELFYFGEMLYMGCVGITKVSILYLYLKLSPQRTFRNVVWGTMAFAVVSTGICVLLVVFQCQPIRKAWHTTLPGHCLDTVALFYANAAIDIALDVWAYLLPVRMLWKLNLPQRQRIALVLIFAVGSLVVVTGLLRLESLSTAAVTKDPTWDNYGSAIWSSISSNVGLICASLVHFKAAVSRYAPRLLGIPPTRSTGSGMRIPDSEDVKDLVTFGGKSGRNRKQGILTELELEESASRTNILRGESRSESRNDL